jgi:hypothetical protein
MLEQGMGEDSIKLVIREREVVDARHSKPCINSLLSRTILSRTELGCLKINSDYPPRRDQICQINSDRAGAAAAVQYAHSSTQERCEKGSIFSSSPLEHKPEGGLGVARSIGFTRSRHRSPIRSHRLFHLHELGFALPHDGVGIDSCRSPIRRSRSVKRGSERMLSNVG